MLSRIKNPFAFPLPSASFSEFGTNGKGKQFHSSESGFVVAFRKAEMENAIRPAVKESAL